MDRTISGLVAVAFFAAACGGDDGGGRDSGGGDADGGRRDTGALDSGRVDSGTDDAGAIDSGAPVDAGDVDAGPAPDAGPLPVDAGPRPVDSGPRPMDAGPRPVDAGPRPRDAGPRPVDSGPRPVDSGPRPRDAGPRDAGPPPCGAPMLPSLGLRNIVGTATFSAPVFVTQAPGSTDTLWVVQRGGRIRLARGGAILPTPFLDISARVTPGGGTFGESGLLGLAFHPGYATNRRFFVYYTAAGTGANVVAEYQRMAGDPDRADPTEITRLVNQTDSEANHNGGMLAFGPDGFLYVAMGDGGGACDRHGANGNGQNLSTLLGKILRLDVDAAPTFTAAGNPFTMPMGLPQIWALGLRNPWRFSFDRRTGDLYIADVGQNEVEEIDFQPAGATGGANYGWRRFEGDVSLPCGATTLATMPHVPPVYVYEHDAIAGRGVIHGCAVTGGYVYRGAAIPELDGVYFFGDYCRGEIGVFRMCSGVATGAQRVAGVTVSDLSSFGQDNAGEIYVTSLGTGVVSQIVRR